ncbi:high-potential iron-sulfur protein [Chitinimonas naiadis]
MNPRRRFMFQLVPAAGVIALSPGVLAAPEKASETDPTAASLGYKMDTSKVDKAKYPKHAANQDCGNCMLFQGKAGDAWGPCPALGNKLVASKGWCSAWVKKA